MADEKQYAAKCPHCGTRLRVRREDLGSQRTCPKCSQVFAVPDPNARKPAVVTDTVSSQTNSTPVDDWQPPVEVPIVCRVCQTRYYARENQVGKRLPCPDCFAENQVFPPPKPKQPSGNVDVRLTGVTTGRPLPSRDPDQFRVVCKVCDSMHYCLPRQSGEKMRCIDCGSIFKVPQPPPKKVKPKLQVGDPGINVRPAAETHVHETNADSLLKKAAEKYHEKESLKPVPPKRPFSEKVWSLPFQLEVLPFLIAVSLLGCFIPFLVGIALQMDGLASLFGMALMSAAGILALLTYMLITTTVMAVVVSSSMGFTKIDYPKVEIFAYVWTGVVFFTSLSVSYGPGVSLGLLIGIPWVAVIALPFTFFVYPFIFLSMLDASSAAVPYTPYIASTLKTSRPAWKKFYLAALPAFLVATLPHGLALWFQTAVGDTQLESTRQLVVFFAAISVSTFGTLVYFRLIGRLAWVIDQDVRSDEEVIEDTESASEEVAVAS